MMKIKTIDILRIFLGLVFLSAGVYRIFNWQKAVSEFSDLKFDFVWLAIIFVIFEILAGILLILNIKTRKVLLLLIVFLGFILLWSLVFFGRNLIANASELFVFNATPTDFFLHFTYFVIVAYLFSISKRG